MTGVATSWALFTLTLFLDAYPPLSSTPRRNAHNVHSPIKGPRLCRAATLVVSRQPARWATLIRLVPTFWFRARVSCSLAQILQYGLVYSTHSPFDSFEI
ncbi:hypothetical protein BC827DRAFT_719558 [Russula dissimulans]|nr:hypothetical protein BC827DRAFT_719558 [Russula dissimulans]